MKLSIIGIVVLCLFSISLSGQSEPVRYYLNGGNKHYLQFGFLNQPWLRYNENNPGSLVQDVSQKTTFDIGLRRTRLQMSGLLSDRVFVYFQFGQNNFNALYNTGSNRKYAAFFHDALCEYKISNENQLKLGGGLTIANGLSRFSQPSIGTIMTTDVPVFAQATVDQTDEFSRKLSVYARGQVGKLDYRLVLSNPFPIQSSGSPLPEISEFSSFSQKGQQLQNQVYLIYQIFEHEPHITPYMNGTYLGKKKVFNIALGAISQKNAMWRVTNTGDTIYQDMLLMALETFLDMPVRKKGGAISAYAGYFITDYGKDYLRYNGIMNVANGSNLNSSNSITGHGPNFGNAFPMFGTGQVFHAQLGYLAAKQKENAKRWMPYTSITIANYERLKGLKTHTIHFGVNCFLAGHTSKLSFDLQNRPVYILDQNGLKYGNRLNMVTLQYQISI